MRTRSRRAAAAAVLLAVTVLAGCGDDGVSEATVEEPAGDFPAGEVLPDRLSVSPDGAQVLADCWEGICRWDTVDGSLAAVDGGGHLAISPDWSVLATADGPTVVLLDAETGEVSAELTGLAGEEATDGPVVQAVAFSPDGALVAAAGPEREVRIWSSAGDDVATISPDSDVYALAFSPDGTRLAAAGGGPVEVFAVPSGDPVGTLPRSSGDGDGLAWSPDGAWLAGPGPGGAPAVWSADDLALEAVLDGHHLEQVAFAPDSETVALTDAEDDTVRIWRPADDRVRELTGHTDDPVAVAFAPDGATVYSVSARDGVLVWDVRSADLRRRLSPA
ncbi:WD40 repeat domain-containing protein [Nocardioides sp. SR21]|uniref:WD40 repeat domain-containing protein n=1 Tax=Nocardioides sp. SR21 TaxID=2919501 RepID=UPI001FA97C84|nr:hypothetical protein [Nocardioides sp. SR21]